MSTFRCPNCEGKIRQKDYDSTFEWYECPGCENCFTFDELLEGGGKALEAADGESEPHKGIEKVLKKAGKQVVAKGKKRQTEIQEDDEAVAEFEQKMLAPRKGESTKDKRHRDEARTKEVVNIMAD